MTTADLWPARRNSRMATQIVKPTKTESLDRNAAASESKSPAKKMRSNIEAINATKHASPGQALRDSETRYRRLFETAKDGILDATTGLITDVNPFLTKLLNYSHGEFLGKALWEIGLFRDIEASKEAFRELEARRYVRYEDLPLKTKDGRSVNVEFVSNVYGENGKKVIQCNVRDITKRKYAERSELCERLANRSLRRGGRLL